MTDLLELYPAWCREDPIFCAVQKALEPSVQELEAHLADCAAQTVVSTATWGLELWERAYGVAVDLSKPLEERRSRIRAKLRGAGTTTAESIRQVAAAFSGGEVEITERPGWVVEVSFVGTLGTPPNLPDLSAALREILPAHVTLRYVYKYNRWSDIRSKKWREIKGKTWEQIKTQEVMRSGK